MQYTLFRTFFVDKNNWHAYRVLVPSMISFCYWGLWIPPIPILTLTYQVFPPYIAGPGSLQHHNKEHIMVTNCREGGEVTLELWASIFDILFWAEMCTSSNIAYQHKDRANNKMNGVAIMTIAISRECLALSIKTQQHERTSISIYLMSPLQI